MTDIINFEDYKNKQKKVELNDGFIIADLGIVVGKYRLFAQELTEDDVDRPEYKEVLKSCTGTIEDLIQLLDHALHSIGSEDCTVEDDNEGA